MANENVTPSTEEQQKWVRLVQKAWADESLKQRLLNDPALLLQEYGIETPAGVDVRVVQDRDTIACLIQPRMLAGELTPSQLSDAVGGSGKTASKPVKYLEIKLKEVLISG